MIQRIKCVLEKPTTKAYLLFLSVALPIVNNFNKFMQQQSPVVHILQQELDGLIRKLMLRFMKFKPVSDCSAVTLVDLDDKNNHLPLEEVFVGHRTSSYLEDNVSLSTFDVNMFYFVCKYVKNCGIIIIIVGISRDFLLVQCRDIIAFILGYLNNKSGSTALGLYIQCIGGGGGGGHFRQGRVTVT